MNVINRLSYIFITGPCLRARLSNAQLECDDDGNYEPLQCRRLDSGMYECRCVEPITGAQIRGTLEEVSDRNEAPDCEDRGKMVTLVMHNRFQMSSTRKFCYENSKCLHGIRNLSLR